MHSGVRRVIQLNGDVLSEGFKKSGTEAARPHATVFLSSEGRGTRGEETKRTLTEQRLPWTRIRHLLSIHLFNTYPVLNVKRTERVGFLVDLTLARQGRND